MISCTSVMLGDAALAHVQLRRDGHVALLGEAAAHVADVLVHAEDLLHHKDDRKGAGRCRHGAVGGNLAIGGGNAHRAGDETFAVGVDHGLRCDRPHGGGKPDCEARG